MNRKIIEVYETIDSNEVNDYIQKLDWILLQTGTRFIKETNELTIYYSLGRLEGTSNERW